MIRVHMGRHPKARHKPRHGKVKKAPALHHAQASAGAQARRDENKQHSFHLGALARKRG